MGAAGMFSIAAGAILYWVLKVDIPGVDERTLGAILIVAGIVALTVSVVSKSQFGNRGLGSGIGLIAAGAILHWAIDFNVSHVDDDALAVILMVAGVVLAAASLIVTSPRLQEGVVAGVLLMSAGAALHWAVRLDVRYLNSQALAVILMVVGVLGIGAAMATQLRLSHGSGARRGAHTPYAGS